jgi:heme A synthase
MRLHVLAVVTVLATLALMTMGSLVHGTGSSLACPDWPLCHDTVFPQMTGGVEFEHTHRLLAAAVVVLTVALAVGVARGRDKGARRVAAGAVGLIVVQATLGAITVLLRLPTVVSVAHLATSMLFLGVLVVLSVRLHPRAIARASAPTKSRRWVRVATVVVFAQIVLGAIVRHTGAALACTTLPLCEASAWPARVHLLHRALGVVACVAVAAASVRARRNARGNDALHIAATVPLVLVLLQIALGVTVVTSWASLASVTVHHTVGACLLASLVLLDSLAGVRFAAPEVTSSRAGSPAGRAR